MRWGMNPDNPVTNPDNPVTIPVNPVLGSTWSNPPPGSATISDRY